MSLESISPEQFIVLLDRIIASQRQCKALMRVLSDEAIAKEMSYVDMYDRVRAIQPEDPLKAFGLDMDQFGELLHMHGAHQDIRPKVLQLTAENNDGAMGLGSSGKKVEVGKLGVQGVIDIHRYISNQLYQVISKVVPGMDSRTATVAAQAYVASRITKKYQVTPEELEAHVQAYTKDLAKSTDFTQLGSLMRSQMNELIERCESPAAKPGGV